MSRPRSLSGIQPTASSFHLGNYLGALRQWVALQQTHEAYYFIADLHAVTVPYEPAELTERTYLAVAQLVAAGVTSFDDPAEHGVIFLQSHLPEHTQLAWVLNGLAGFGEASRMTQFKDKSARGTGASVGLFTYPVLQAADILLYQPQHVPVGEDQRQHVELTRNLAQRFNHRFGEVFTVPEPYIVAGTAKILDLQDPTAKMSKSTSAPNGIVNLLDDPKKAAKKIRSAVTDSETEIRYDPEAKPGVSNLLTIYAALTDRPVTDVETEFSGRQYGELKVALGDLVAETVDVFGRRTRELLADQKSLDDVLAQGRHRAGELAARTLADVYDRSGFVPAR